MRQNPLQGYANQLSQRAQQIASEQQAKSGRDIEELGRLRRKVREFEERIGQAREGSNRADRFTGFLDQSLACPNCYVRDGRESPLSPSGGGSAENELFRCKTCGAEFELEAN
jgi:hypothetical protein